MFILVGVMAACARRIGIEHIDLDGAGPVHALVGHQSLEHRQTAGPHPHDGYARASQDKPCEDAFDSEITRSLSRGR